MLAGILITIYFVLNLFMLFLNQVALMGLKFFRDLDDDALFSIGYSSEDIEDIRKEQRGEKLWAKVALLLFGTILFLLGLGSLVYEKIIK